jgi:hypothetical protein
LATTALGLVIQSYHPKKLVAALDGAKYYIFSHIKIEKKDVCFALSESEFVIGVLKQTYVEIHTKSTFLSITFYYY